MKVVVYGIGKRYFDLFDYKETVDMGIIKNGVDIIGFSDSNPEIFGKKIIYNGKQFKVKSLYNFSKDDFEKIMVTTVDYFEEIREGLIKEGYKSDQIFLVDDILEPNHELIGYVTYSLLNKEWMEIFEKMKNVAYFFDAAGYKSVAIYGIGIVAERLIHILKQSRVEIQYLLDVNENKRPGCIPVFRIGAILPLVDIIIVTENDNYMEIERKICEKNPIEVISMQELVYKILKNCKTGIETCAI